MAGQDSRAWGSSAGGTVVSATGSAAAGAPGSTTRPAGREPQTPCREITATDSFDRSDSCRLAGGVAANATPFPYQATAVGLQWFRSRDSRQRRVPLCKREATTKPGAHHRARSESQPKPRSENSVQRRCHICQYSAWTTLRFLCCSGRERDAADDGASHPGTKDGRHYVNHLEERSGVRRQTIESASSLSVSRNDAFPSPMVLSGGGRSGSQDARVRGEYQSMRSALCASAPSHPLHAMPPRITRNSDRPRASDRTMVAT